MKAIRGIRVRQEALDPGAVICPPYDVISPVMHQELLDHSPHNAVRWILGDDPGGPLDDEVYRGCGEAMKSALEEKLLIQEQKPALYRYQVRYQGEAGEEAELHGILAAVESRPWGEGVLRHEEVRPHTVKRLVEQARCTGIDTGVVMLTCEGLERALSEVGVGVDSGDLVFERPDWQGDVHTLRRIDDPDLVAQLESQIEAIPSAVADGHHRYTTALTLSDDADFPGARRVLAFLCDLHQPGLKIRPTHRVWTWNTELSFSSEQVRDRLVEVLDDGEGDRWSIEIPGGERVDLQCRQDASRPTLARRVQDVIDEFKGLPAPATPHQPVDAREILNGGERGVFCELAPVGRDEFWTRVLAGEIFPPKTTFFEPKISTGLVARFIDQEDHR
ncbi:MAG: DUF1015 domain-containing protein [Planctomycetota bacterium]|nr:DUF1015 domain-containing protein [Planctomycetota bacterium]